MIRGSRNGCPHWQSDRSPDIPTRKISVSQTPVFINGEQIFDGKRQGNQWKSACTCRQSAYTMLALVHICHISFRRIYSDSAVLARKRDRATGTDTATGTIYACLDKPPAGLSESPRFFGLTKMLGGYHYRQSRNDNPTPPRSHQPKGKSET